jgi:hypothetical protein
LSYQGDVDAIAAINATVPGIQVAYNSTNLPQQIAMGPIPAAITIVAPGDWTRFGFDEYVVRVYVSAVLNGNPALGYQSCIALLDAFRKSYNDLLSINDRPLIRAPHGHTKTAKGFGTSGFYYTVKWSSVEYYGFEVYLPLGPGSADTV